MALVFVFSNLQITYAQDMKVKSSPLPESMKNIFHTSCMPCHWNDGKKMAMSMVNFSKWEEYDSEKQAKKASLICKTLKKGKMPPKSARKLFPQSIPTKEQIDLICEWADSFKSK
jgi:hypothetical protein